MKLVVMTAVWRADGKVEMLVDLKVKDSVTRLVMQKVSLWDYRKVEMSAAGMAVETVVLLG